MARRVLVLFAHPALEKSRVNRALLAAPKAVEGVTLHDLYERYPDLIVDVAREQALLLEHDVVVFQHPFYWYSTPALLKEWQDQVLEHGWAYGRGGDRLRGKLTLNVVTSGGPRQAYTATGYNRFTIRQLLAPYEQTAHLTGMRFLAPLVVSGTHALVERGDRAALEGHVDRYRRALVALRDDTLDLDRAAQVDELGEVVDTPREVH